MKLLWTEEALVRLKEIEEYIAQDNPKAAADFVDKLISLAETIPDNPEKGRIVSELSIEFIRELLHKNYRIVYLIKRKSIDVLTVFEGHQLLKKEEIIRSINLLK
ncbi:MAG: plasmid stabilization protein [Ignavibacteriae bacterium]|nr:MAG: plasmid stabilization protein [Ignavibacteriota bacterium]